MKWLLSMVGVMGALVVVTLLAFGARDGRARATAAIEIERAPAAIFPLLVQPELRKQWLLGVDSVTAMGDPTLRSGSRSRVVLDIPERIEVEEEIRVVDINHRLLFQRSSSHPQFAQRLEYALKEVPGGRALVTAATYTTYGGMFFGVLEPLITRAGQVRLQQEMLQLRMLAEAPATATAAPALPVMATPMVPAEAPGTTAAPPPPETPVPTPPPPPATTSATEPEKPAPEKPAPPPPRRPAGPTNPPPPESPPEAPAPPAPAPPPEPAAGESPP